MPEGYRLTEIATELGVSPSWVSERLGELRNELLLSAGRFFPLGETEYAALRQSISDDDVQVPIVIGRYVPLVDGRHRCKITLELGRSEIPAVFLTDKTAEEERELSTALNAARRQLTRAQKQALIRNELAHDPSRSDRRIAAVTGTDHKTVGDARAAMAEEARLHDVHDAPDGRTRFEPESRVDSLGRAQPAPSPRVSGGDVVDGDKPLGHADCCHGVRHAILRDGESYRLEAR